MYRFRITAAGVIAVAALAACSENPATSDQTLIPQQQASIDAVDQVVPGQVLVKFKDVNAAISTARALGTPIQNEGYKHAFSIVSVPEGQEYAEAARLKADPRVEWAEPNYIRHLDAIDSRLWAFYNPGGLNMKFSDPTDSRYGTYIPSSYASYTDADEDAIEGIAANGGDVVISSIDTGVDFNHPEFSGRLIAGCDWFSQAAAGNSSG
ncbi:MAG TPA: hypothetical protein VF771_10580, partial [Longimicrobiaceae bacterium]